MRFLPSVTAVDPSLGRLDFASLSDQARMELLIEGLTDESKVQFHDPHDDFLDVCDWWCVTCNAQEEVTKVTFYSWGAHIYGPLRLEFLPPTVTTFEVGQHDHTGTLETAYLPQELTYIFLNSNKFSGTVDMENLPHNLQDFDIGINCFAGSFKLTNLPKRLESLRAYDNQLSGELAFESLPETLRFLSLHTNQFCGKVILRKLPKSLIDIRLSYNSFCGDFALVNIPNSLVTLRAIDCGISGEVMISRGVDDSRLRLMLDDNSIQSVRDENGEAHPLEVGILERQKKAV